MSSTPTQKLVFVTGNKNKLAEAQGILGNHFQLESVNIDLPELQGTSQEVAIGKCIQAAEIVMSTDLSLLRIPVLDSTPSMDFLDPTCTHLYEINMADRDAFLRSLSQDLMSPWYLYRSPITSKWFLQGVGLDGLNKMLDGFSDRSASAFCTIAYSRGPGTEPILFDGRVQGKIVAARGPTNFGWDPVFQPDGYDKTYAEIEPAVKNTMSHRYKALVMLREFLDKENK
ncbi:hypothetical protein KVV02_006070 [Mortierella alpina]|uniref:Uncharacterized protein n=1 Tax=Mortierella alpina TaxID=64518 RepID=A0A9P7ZXK6_MORAP|nr:hypothetical protein KVV02_006070 [Mortierella alpina]